MISLSQSCGEEENMKLVRPLWFSTLCVANSSSTLCVATLWCFTLWSHFVCFNLGPSSFECFNLGFVSLGPWVFQLHGSEL